MVDALDLGSSAARCESSSLSVPTIIKARFDTLLFYCLKFDKLILEIFIFHYLDMQKLNQTVTKLLFNLIAKKKWVELKHKISFAHFIR